MSLAARGHDEPSQHDALVLECLEKKPERRPQGAAELIRRLEACGGTPCTAEDARKWWSEHRSEMEREEAPSAETGRTIEVAANAQHNLQKATLSESGLTGSLLAK